MNRNVRRRGPQLREHQSARGEVRKVLMRLGLLRPGTGRDPASAPWSQAVRFCLYAPQIDADRDQSCASQLSVRRLDKGVGEAQTRGWAIVSRK